MKRFSGKWYNDYAYFRYSVFAKPFVTRQLYRLVLTPYSFLSGLIDSLQHRLIISHVEFVLTTCCNLRCRDCANLIQYYRQPAHLDADLILQDLQTLADSADMIYKVLVMGGEPLIYPDLNKVLRTILEMPKIGMIHLVTNGTIIPKPDTLDILSHPRVYVTVSEYPEKLAPRREKLLQMLHDRGIPLKHFPPDWTALGGLDHKVPDDDRNMSRRFRRCNRTVCNSLLDGKFFICPRSAHGARIGQFELPDYDFVQIRGRHDFPMIRDELKALGKLPYLAACAHCNGVDGPPVPAALQMSE
ncbi:MAG: radical SAM protein [Deltaproteobacteria bacterium]